MAYDEISKPLSVREANALIKSTLDESFYQLVVKGEISGYKVYPSGHAYFDLKDSDATLPSIVFRSSLVTMPSFKNGDLVVATGRITLYEKTGKLSFIITRITNAGDGELQAMIEKRKLYYQNLGWFDPALKKPLPKEIKTLGIVTSAQGAVFHDILDVTRRRAPGLDIVLFPCAVQGEGAEITIASRIRQANNFDNVDLLIVGRGGGSQEDLSPFSTDEVIVAIHESHIPVISAVGHEVDWALSDYVADMRGGTPSIAAEMATAEIFRRRESLSSLLESMDNSMRSRVYKTRERLPDTHLLLSLLKERIASARLLIPQPVMLSTILERKLQDAEYKVAMLTQEEIRAMEERVAKANERLSRFTMEIEGLLPPRIKELRAYIKSLKKEISSSAGYAVSISTEKLKTRKKELEALSPLSVLKRGYALVTDESGNVVRDTRKTKDGDVLNIRVEKGNIRTIVQKEKI